MLKCIKDQLQTPVLFTVTHKEVLQAKVEGTHEEVGELMENCAIVRSGWRKFKELLFY